MTLVWIVLGLLAAYVVYGLVVRSNYSRVFPADLQDTPIQNGYLHPQEVIDADEVELASRISTAFENDSLRLPKFAGRDDPGFHERHWGHTAGLLQGRLEIDTVNNLPEQFRLGLFAKNASYPVVARIGTAKDADLGFVVTRIAVKLSYPEAVPNMYTQSGEAKELDLLLAAGEPTTNGAGHAFFARDARQLDMATTLKPPSLKTLQTLSNWRNIAALAGITNAVKKAMKPMREAPSTTSGWAGTSYFSLGPFALGDTAMKFSLTPRQTHPVPETDLLKADVAATDAANMQAWLAAGEDAEFDLGIQLATPECIPEPGPGDPPKSVMAAEYCDLHWDEDKSPYIRVGRLTLRAEEAINLPSLWGSIQFNAWNTLPTMQPLGQLFRMRKHVHTAHSNVRVSHLHGGEPGELSGKCPFAD